MAVKIRIWSAMLRLFQGREELRLDERLMQLLRFSNAVLRGSHVSVLRQLRVRTFGVIPLGPRTGLIEWVEHSVPLFGLYQNSLRHSMAAVATAGKVLHCYTSTSRRRRATFVVLLQCLPMVVYVKFSSHYFHSNKGACHGCRTCMHGFVLKTHCDECCVPCRSPEYGPSASGGGSCACHEAAYTDRGILQPLDTRSKGALPISTSH